MSKKNGRPDRWAYKWVGHIEHYFNDREVGEAIAWIEARNNTPDRSVEIIAQKGIRVSFSYSERSDSFRVTLQPKRKEHPYVGYTVGYSHVSLARCFQVSAYIVEELMEHGAIPIPGSDTADDW